MAKFYRFFGAIALIAVMTFLVTAAGNAQRQAVLANQGCITRVNGYIGTSFTECR